MRTRIHAAIKAFQEPSKFDPPPPPPLHALPEARQCGPDTVETVSLMPVPPHGMTWKCTATAISDSHRDFFIRNRLVASGLWELHPIEEAA